MLHNKEGTITRFVQTLYGFQLERDEKFDMQLFWDYLHDRSQSVWVQYKGLGTTEVGSLSMPGHYASLTVDRLGQG